MRSFVCSQACDTKAVILCLPRCPINSLKPLPVIESALRMELLLNLLWVLLAALMASLWVRFTPCGRSARRMQFIALALLLLLLFPVISVTDDLQAAQSPAEADCCLRRDHGCTDHHFIAPPFAALAPSAFAWPPFASLRLPSRGFPPTPALDRPELDPIQNRPPPAA